MSKTLKQLSICSMALMMSGIFGVGNSLINANHVNAHASRIHRRVNRRTNYHKLINIRIKSTYNNFRKMDFDNNHALALTDLIAFQNPSMRSKAEGSGHVYGYYQLPKKVIEKEAIQNHMSTISLRLQTNVLFQSFNHHNPKRNIKRFAHRKGSVRSLTRYMFHRYFAPSMSKKYTVYNKPLSRVITAVNSSRIQMPKVHKFHRVMNHKTFKSMINREVKDNKEQKQQQKTKPVINNGNTISNANPSSNTNNSDGTGAISEVIPSDGELSWKPSNVPSDVKPYIHDPKDVGMDYGSSTGWSDPGDQCVNFANSYFHNIWGINNPSSVMGNGVDIANAWNQAINGSLSTTPHAGAVGSTTQDALTGGNPDGHTFVVEHVFANGDILVAEENWPEESGSDDGLSNTWNYAVFSKNLMSKNTKFFMPSSQYHLKWSDMKNSTNTHANTNDNSSIVNFW